MFRINYWKADVTYETWDGVEITHTIHMEKKPMYSRMAEWCVKQGHRYISMGNVVPLTASITVKPNGTFDIQTTESVKEGAAYGKEETENTETVTAQA